MAPARKAKSININIDLHHVRLLLSKHAKTSSKVKSSPSEKPHLEDINQIYRRNTSNDKLNNNQRMVLRRPMAPAGKTISKHISCLAFPSHRSRKQKTISKLKSNSRTISIQKSIVVDRVSDSIDKSVSIEEPENGLTTPSRRPPGKPRAQRTKQISSTKT